MATEINNYSNLENKPLQSTELVSNEVGITPKKANLINLSTVPGEIQLSNLGEYKRDQYLDPIESLYNPEEVDYERARLQRGSELWGKAIGQGLAEATMGSIEGAGYLLDFEDLFNTDDMATRDFDNWFSKYIRQAKEHVQEEWKPIS